MAAGFCLLPIHSIRANPLQPRRRFDQDKLKELAESIQIHGVVQPVVVTREIEGFRLVVGERRWRASQLAGLEHIPAIIQDLAPQNLLEVALIENLQRQDLNPIEEAKAFYYLQREHDLTQEQLAQRLGCSRPAIANSLRLLGLPSAIQADLEAGILSAGHARAALALDCPRRQVEAWKAFREQHLSVRAAEDWVRRLRHPPPSASPPRLAPDWEQIQRELSENLGAVVKIKPSNSRQGRLELHYRDQQQLEELVEVLIRLGEGLSPKPRPES